MAANTEGLHAIEILDGTLPLTKGGIRLLMAGISRDPMVVVKILQQVESDVFFLLATDLAIGRHWHDPAIRYLKKRPDLYGRTFLFPIANEEASAATIEALLITQLNQLHSDFPIGEVVVDTTTGQGFFRVLLALIISRWTARNGVGLRLIHCDGDNETVRSLAVRGESFDEDRRPLVMSWRDEPLVERLGIYGMDVEPGKSPCLWREGYRKEPPRDAIKRLRHRFLESVEIRAFFCHVYRFALRHSDLRKPIDQRLALDCSQARTRLSEPMNRWLLAFTLHPALAKPEEFSKVKNGWSQAFLNSAS